MRFQNDENLEIFQSTLPVWGATHPIFGEDLEVVISIHAPRVGSDRRTRETANGALDFNPRSPCGERLFLRLLIAVVICISIHAPRVGSDGGGGASGSRLFDFNPRSPCGERPAELGVEASDLAFQSTLPVWGATRLARHAHNCRVISIHAPRVGSDRPVIHHV